MKKLILCAGVFTSLLLSSCNSSTENEVEALPFQSKEDGKWGMVQTDGKLLFEEEFLECPTVARNGRFMVKNANNLWEIYTVDKKPRQVGKDEYLGITSFCADVTPAVKKGERITLIDKNGKVKATLDKAGGHNIQRCYGFHEGYARIYTDKGYGLINTSGKVVIEPNYCEMFDCSDGKVIAIESKYANEDENKRPYVVLDTSGKVLYTIKAGKYDKLGSDYCTGYKHGRLIASQEEDGERKSGLLDDKGEVALKLSEKNRWIIDLAEKNFIFYDGEGCGLKNYDGEVIIRAKYNELTFDSYAPTVLWARDGNKWTLLDLEDNEITKEEYTAFCHFYDGKHAFVRISSREIGMIDLSGKEMRDLPDIYDISINDGDEYVESDYIDADALIEAFNITSTSIGNFRIDMSPKQAVQIWAKENNESGDLEPDYFIQKFLSYNKESEGVTIKYSLYYESNMAIKKSSSWWEYDYQWADIKPSAIFLSTNGAKMTGNIDQIYGKLLTKIKSMGKPLKERSSAIVVTVAGGRGIILEKLSGNIHISLYGSDEYKTVPIADEDVQRTNGTDEYVD